MTNAEPTFALQKLIFCLPQFLRRIRVAQFIGLRLMRTRRHALEFSGSSLVGDIRDGAMANHLIRKAFADFGYFSLARNILREGDVHLDIGANFGFHTYGLLSGAELRSGHFIMVDANPECVACQAFSNRLHPGVRLVSHQAAVGAGTAELWLQFDTGDMASGYLRKDTSKNDQTTGARTEKVVCRKIDDILQEAGCGPVRLMKMDIEGSELAALQGAGETLRAGNIRYFYFEVNAGALRRQDVTVPALLEYVRAAGFKLFWPHASFDWINLVCKQKFDPSREHFARLPGRDGLKITQFDPVRHILPADCQLDLLAVHESEELAAPG